MDTEEDILIEKLEQIGISIPEEADFSRLETGLYQWSIDKKIKGNQLIRGSLTCEYFNDDTIKRVSNNIVDYKKVREVSIKTEFEAYDEILSGNFRAFYMENNIETIDIYDIVIDYQMDSKGFYQPVYIFDSKINGEQFTIFFPAMQ